MLHVLFETSYGYITKIFVEKGFALFYRAGLTISLYRSPRWYNGLCSHLCATPKKDESEKCKAGHQYQCSDSVHPATHRENEPLSNTPALKSPERDHPHDEICASAFSLIPRDTCSQFPPAHSTPADTVHDEASYRAHLGYPFLPVHKTDRENNGSHRSVRHDYIRI